MTSTDALDLSKGESSIVSRGGSSSIEEEIERLRRQLDVLENSQSSRLGGGGRVRESSKTRTRRRLSRKSSMDAFGHLSRSTRNLGQRQQSSDSLMATTYATATSLSRSTSIVSTGGSVGGIFGDSDSESSDDESNAGIRRAYSSAPTPFDVLTRGYIMDETLGRSKRSDSFAARRGSDDDMKAFTTDDDDYHSGENSGPSPPMRGLLKSRRQNSYRNVRSISMQPMNYSREDVDFLIEESSEAGQIQIDDIVERVKPFLTHPGDEPLASKDDGASLPSESSDFGKSGESTNTSISHESSQENLQRRRHKVKLSAVPRRSSYGNVLPLAIGPGGQAALMEASNIVSSHDSDDDHFTNFETLCAPSFSQFALLQIQAEQLLLVENEYLFADDGPTHLDSFILNQEMEFGDHFTADNRNPIDPTAVGSFCFPDGLKIRYLPKAGLKGAERMGWVGPKGDRCHIMVFTNGSGMTDHGVAITIQWEMSMKRHERQCLSKAVYNRRKRRRASRLIQCWWRRTITNRVLREALLISGFHSQSPADLKAELTSSELKLLEKALKTVKHSNESGSITRKQLKRKGTSKKLKPTVNRRILGSGSDTSTIEEVTRAAMMRSPSSALLGLETSTQDSTGSELPDIDEGEKTSGPSAFFPMFKSSSTRSGRFSMRSLQSTRSAMSLHASPPPLNRSISPLVTSHDPHRSPSDSLPTREITRRISKRTVELARESYETMKANDRMGSVCVVEKCYTLIGCQPDEHSLLLGPLQQLIDSERNEILAFRRSRSDVSDKKRPKEVMTDVDEERRLELDLRSRRRQIIGAMREKLRLTTRQALVTYPRTQLEHITGKVNYFETWIPQIPNSEAIKLPLPLPRIGKEWALAQFMLDIGPDSLVLSLKLLLLERSILVLGDNLQKVTLYACALLELLKPFEWTSAFMPVLPRRMLDFINCPVPFIAGVAVHDVAEVENDSRVFDAMSNGMSLLNLKTNTLHITTEQGMSRMISLDPYLREQLKLLRTRLQHILHDDPHSPLRNFNTFVKFGLSRRESLTLLSVCRVLENHFSQFCGDLAMNDKAWKRYGTIDVKTNEFVFNPEWFLNPIRADQAFHEAMVQTQLFSGYVHERREDQIEMQEIMEGDLGYFIAEWVYEKWMARKRRRKNMFGF